MLIMLKFKCNSLIFVLALICAGNAAAADRFTHVASMQQVNSGNYYVHGDFGNGIEDEFLVDTGSGYVALSPKTFSRLKGDPTLHYLRDITGRMANGDLIKVPVYQVGSLKLGNDCTLTNVEVTVIPGSDRNILGLSALRKAEPFAMQLSPPELLLSNCTANPIAQL